MKQEVITTAASTTLLDVLKTHPNGINVFDSKYGEDSTFWKLPMDTMDAQKALIWMLAERITVSNVDTNPAPKCLANLNEFVKENLDFIQNLTSYSDFTIGPAQDPVYPGIKTVQDFANPDGNYPQLDALKFVSYLDPLIGPSLSIDARWY